MVVNPFAALLALQAENTSEICEKHNIPKIRIFRSGNIVCSACESEKIGAENQKLVDDFAVADKENKRQFYLNKFSLFDEVLANATLDNFDTPTTAEAQKLSAAEGFCSEWIDGKRNNIIFVGNPGTGKSHLAFGIIKRASEMTKEFAIFMNVADLFSILKKDFSQEFYILEQISKAKFLVLDDLGMENNTEWTYRVLYSILNNRSNTLVTTNMSADKIEERYGRPFLDRIMKGVDKEHVLKFEDLKSKRRVYF
jgi:DNA replication protein DnaC